MGCSVTPSPGPPPIFSRPHRQNPNHIAHLTRRSIILSTLLSLALKPPPSYASPPSPPPPDTTITDRVFMDFSLCGTYFRPLSSPDPKPNLCPDSIPFGSLVLGLYGHLVPLTVANFKSMCTSSAYKGTLVHKLFPDQFFLACHQGHKPCNVRRPSGLARNDETVDSKCFALTHSRPSLISLSLSENDDEDDIKLDPEYRNVEFFITTGPCPCPDLDYKNIVFGSVLEGMDVVTAIAAIPTYIPKPYFAEFLGDERAGNARALWNKPLKTVYISDLVSSMWQSLPFLLVFLDHFMHIAFAYNIYNCSYCSVC